MRQLVKAKCSNRLQQCSWISIKHNKVRKIKGILPLPFVEGTYILLSEIHSVLQSVRAAQSLLKLKWVVSQCTPQKTWDLHIDSPISEPHK